MNGQERLRQLIAADGRRREILLALRELDLPDAWIGAGFVRNAVWDMLHGYPRQPPDSDIDVIWFDPRRSSAELDAELEAHLRQAAPGLEWSVRNQARMHLRNGDQPYSSSTQAMCYWPETATAVALRCNPQEDIEIAAPLGLGDLWQGVVRPTAAFCGDKYPIFLERVASRRWLQRWPGLRLERGRQDRGAGDVGEVTWL